MSTHRDKNTIPSGSQDANGDDEELGTNEVTEKPTIPFVGHDVDLEEDIIPLHGIWAALSEGVPESTTSVKGLLGGLPKKFEGLATPEKNPMSMQLSHEEVVVGCADGTI
jgi:pyrimidine and pyridine-specific 5'-nucleotidase